MLSIPHLVVIFLVALVVLGPEKLPQVARVMGKAMADFRRITNDFRVQIEDEMRDMERQANIRKATTVAPVPATNPELVPAAFSETADRFGENAVEHAGENGGENAQFHENPIHENTIRENTIRENAVHENGQSREITVHPVNEPPELTAEIDSAIAAAQLSPISSAPVHSAPADAGSDAPHPENRAPETVVTETRATPVHENPADGESQPA